MKITNTLDELVKSSHCCHCEERSDAAISVFLTDTNYEIASLRAQKRLFLLLTGAGIVAVINVAGSLSTMMHVFILQGALAAFFLSSYVLARRVESEANLINR